MIDMKKQLLILGLTLFMGVQTLTIAGTVEKNSTVVAGRVDEKKVIDDAIKTIVEFREGVIFTAMGDSLDIDEITANLMSIPDGEFNQIVQVTAKMMKFTGEMKSRKSKMTASQRRKFEQELQFFETWMDTLISIYPMRG